MSDFYSTLNFFARVEAGEIDAVLEASQMALECGHHDKAVELLSKAKANGSTKAALMLGRMYANGQGLPKNIRSAAFEFTWAAAKGDSAGYLELGRMYFHGNCCPPNITESLTWFTKSAESGNREAMEMLGWIYDNGSGGATVNHQLAFSWFFKAAHLDSAEAQANLGIMYEDGRGVDQSSDQAFEWFSRSAANGSPNGQFNLGRILLMRAGENNVPNYPAAAINFQKAARSNHTEAKIQLGLMWFHGLGIQKSYNQAAKLMTEAAMNGSSLAAHLNGHIFEARNDESASLVEALAWFEIASASIEEAAAKAVSLKNSLNQNDIEKAMTRVTEISQSLLSS